MNPSIAHGLALQKGLDYTKAISASLNKNSPMDCGQSLWKRLSLHVFKKTIFFLTQPLVPLSIRVATYPTPIPHVLRVL